MQRIAKIFVGLMPSIYYGFNGGHIDYTAFQFSLFVRVMGCGIRLIEYVYKDTDHTKDISFDFNSLNLHCYLYSVVLFCFSAWLT